MACTLIFNPYAKITIRYTGQLAFDELISTRLMILYADRYLCSLLIHKGWFIHLHPPLYSSPQRRWYIVAAFFSGNNRSSDAYSVHMDILINVASQLSRPCGYGYHYTHFQVDQVVHFTRAWSRSCTKWKFPSLMKKMQLTATGMYS